MSKVSVFNYDNRGTRSKGVEVGPLRLWFSYETCIAFQVDGHNRVVMQNYWGPTTGHHLTSIDGGGKEAKAARLDRDTFNARLEQIQIKVKAAK